MEMEEEVVELEFLPEEYLPEEYPPEEYLPEEYLSEEYIPEEDSQIIWQLQEDGSKNYVWDQEMTFSLIHEYKNHLQDFLFPQGQIRDLWENISYNMQLKGYDVTPAACDNKWRQLKKTFRYNAPYGGKKGRKPQNKWIYYEALEDILGNRKIAKRLVWKQRSTIKKEKLELKFPDEYTQEERFVNEFEETEEQYTPIKRARVNHPPKWFGNFLNEYQEEEKEKKKVIKKMHTDLVAVERQKCMLLENLIKKLPKTKPVSNVVDAVSHGQEVIEDKV